MTALPVTLVYIPHQLDAVNTPVDLPVRACGGINNGITPHLSHGFGVPSCQVVVGGNDQHGAFTG